MTLSTKNGRFVVDGRETFLLVDTVWSAPSDATDDEWSFYLRHRSRQGFNGALVSVLPILHDRSIRDGGLAPFDEEDVRSNSTWHFEARYFSRLRERLERAREFGVTLCPVLLWVNYVEGTWAAERTPGFVMPEPARQEYLDRLADIIEDSECLLIISGDPAFESVAEVESYRSFASEVRRRWPQSVIAFHSAPTAELPAELDQLADALLFQSGHHAEQPRRALQLASRYRGTAGQRPVMNAEPAYEAHRMGGGVGRFSQATVRRRIWESVVAGASEGVAYGAHGLWGWHRGSEDFSSVHFSGTPLDWREALFLPGADDAARCRQLMQETGVSRLGARPEVISVADEGWGAEDVVIGVAEGGHKAVVYLPNGGPVTLRAPGGLALERSVSLPDVRAIEVTPRRTGEGLCVIDPPGNVTECVLFVDL